MIKPRRIIARLRIGVVIVDVSAWNLPRPVLELISNVSFRGIGRVITFQSDLRGSNDGRDALTRPQSSWKIPCLQSGDNSILAWRIVIDRKDQPISINLNGKESPVFARFNKWTEFPFRSLSNRQDPIWTRERKSKYFIKRYSPGGKYEQFCRTLFQVIFSVFSFFFQFFFLFEKEEQFRWIFDPLLPFFFAFGRSMMRELKEETGGMVIMAYWIFKLA